MNKISKLALVVALVALAAGTALATPVPSTAVALTRVFNDTPFSVLNVTNTYPDPDPVRRHLGGAGRLGQPAHLALLAGRRLRRWTS
jgi:hypothetical protein